MFVLSLGRWFGHFAHRRREEAAAKERKVLAELAPNRLEKKEGQLIWVKLKTTKSNSALAARKEAAEEKESRCRRHLPQQRS
jgi:hypothetical protein